MTLPPAFAPEMPQGDEVLYFAPGMFDAKSDEFFRYVFALEFASAQPIATDSWRRLLVQYYKGLMEAVARGREVDDEIATEVSVVKDGKGLGESVFRICTVDAFVTGDRLCLLAHLELGHTDLGRQCLTAWVHREDAEPEPPSARACLPCRLDPPLGRARLD